MCDEIGNWGCESRKLELKRPHFTTDAVMKLRPALSASLPMYPQW